MLVQWGAAGFGLTLPQLLSARAVGAATGSAKSCIWIFLSGGPSQYETFDPKPDAPLEYRGTFKPIRTNVPGIDVTEHLPLLAKQAHRYALIRSLTHTEPNHPAGCYWLMTGYKYPRATSLSAALSREDRPHHGSVLARLRPTDDPGLPSFVTLPEQIQPNGPIRSGQHAGFLGAAYDPMVIHSDPNAPDFTPGELKISEGLSGDRLLRRRALLRQTNRLTAAESGDLDAPLQPQYVKAFDLLTGGAANRAFDLSRETAATKDRYGRHVFGQSTLLARRLVEAGVRLVAVNWVRHDYGNGGQGWDTHEKHLQWSKDELLPPTDRAVSALLEDLAQRGLLDETLVVVTGEFGRTPKFNPQGGRDHWPNVFSTLVAGGGIRGGQVYGSSTRDGAYVASDPVTPGDLAATLYHCLGVDPRAEITDQQNRPFAISDGEVLSRLL
jgi:hypothetical protein